MNFDQKKSIGFHFVVDLLAPKSGQGKKALRHLEPCANEQMLTQEYQSLYRVLDVFSTRKDDVKTVQGLLSQVKDIDATFSRLGAEIGAIELFEIRSFCDASIRIKALLDGLGLRLVGAELPDLSAPYGILSESGAEGFLVGGEQCAALNAIRVQKNKCTRALMLASGEEKEELTREHLALSVREQEEESKLYLALSHALLAHQNALFAASSFVAKLDLLLEKARLVWEKNAIIPTLSKAEFVLRGATNPCIAHELCKGGKTFAPISVALEKTTVITGANMGGKTVALKTVALNAYLFSCAFPIFAKEARLPFLRFVEIVSEDLKSSERGLSSFGGELVQVNALYRRSKQERGLLLVDEFAGGTNVEEGKRIFSALLQALQNSLGYAVLTTHLDGVSQYAQKRYQIIGLSSEKKHGLKHMTKVSARDIADFMDYGLVEVSKDERIPQDAIDVAMILGLDDEIISHL